MLATANIAGSVDPVPVKKKTTSRVQTASLSHLPRTHQFDGHFFSIDGEIDQLEKNFAVRRKIDQCSQYTSSTLESTRIREHAGECTAMIGFSIQPRANLASRVGKTRFSRKRGRRTLACALESLEQRTMLTTWIGGSGDWSDAADWSTGAVPGSTDQVTIPAGSNVSISKAESAGTLTTAAGSTLTLGSNAEDPFSFSLSGGGTINGTFNWGGTLDGSSAVLTCAGTTVVTGSTSGGDFANTGDMTFNGGGIYQSNFTNSGAVSVTGGILLGQGTITNSPGATFSITDDSSFVPSDYIGTTSGTFINEGTFTKSGGTGTSLFPSHHRSLGRLWRRLRKRRRHHQYRLG